jgi:hypothetical protein
MTEGAQQPADFPVWIAQPFDLFASYCKDSMIVFDRSLRGLRLVSDTALAEHLPAAPPEQHAAMIEGERSAFIRHARLVLGQGIVTLWGYLEVFVHDLLGVWMAYRPDMPARLTTAKIKLTGDLLDYEHLPLDERYEQLAKLLLDKVPGHGIDAYEKAFEIVGLGGAPPPNTQSVLDEMRRVRNVLVHRGGVADRAFAQGRADLGVAAGELVARYLALYTHYVHAVFPYVAALLVRAGRVFGLAVHETEIGGRYASWLPASGSASAASAS